MKRLGPIILLAALPLLAYSLTSQAQAKPSCKTESSAPRTVSDYFKMLPDEYFEGDSGVEKALESAAVRDEANDYIETRNESGAPLLIVTLFRHQGRVLVAVNVHNKHADYIEVLRPKNGHYEEVTEDVIPGYDADASGADKKLYVLPRRGTTIRVYQAAGKNEDDHGSHLYDLTWRNGRFSIKR